MFKKLLTVLLVVTMLFTTVSFANSKTKPTQTKKAKVTTTKKKTTPKKTTTKKKVVVKKAPTKKTKPAPKKPVPAKKKATPKPTVAPTEEPTIEPSVEPTLTPEQQKRADGYIKKTTLGVEYKRDAALWAKYDDNIDTYGFDEDPTANDPEFDARFVGYLSNEDLAAYYDALKITDAAQKKAKVNEILSHEKMVYSIVVYKKTPTEDMVKKDIQCKNYVKIGESDGYSFYFGYNDYDENGLTSDASKQAFKALYDDAMVIKSTMTVFKPMTSEEGIMSLKKFTFNVKDINGNDVNESIFKDNKLTMVNIWGTYCGPCIREMPTLQQLSTELKTQKIGVVGIVSDVYTTSGLDSKLVDKAKQILSDAKVTYTNLIPDETMKYDSVLAYVSAIPTSFFVDSEGNIVGEVRIGDGSKDEYIQLINKILNKQKRSEGYIKKTTLGVEYKRAADLWAKYDDNLDTYGFDEDPTANDPEFDARFVGYLSNEDLAAYYEAVKITDAAQKKAKVNEILSHEKMVYSIVVYKKTPTDDQVKKDIKCKNYVKIGEADGYSFYFGYNDYDENGLTSDASKQAFKALYDDAMVIKSTMTVFKPMTSEEGIMSLKKFTFNLKDINGNDVNESIFKDNKLTMVNIWGTYCGPCIREMPTLQQLSTELKNQKVGVVGIVSDVYTSSGLDSKLVDKAKQILSDAKVTYTNLLPDETMKYDGVLSYLSAIPTTFFVDSEGNIVGEVRIGDGTKDEYTQLINKILSTLK